ncbi:unnamed protein product, partial [Polarella glacialis]
AQPLRADGAFVGVSGFGYGGTNSHALAYGKNVLTSRGESQKHLFNAIVRKVRTAAAPEVRMDAESFEHWTSTGVPHLSVRSGQTFRVELQAGGRALWVEAKSPPLAAAGRFHLQGSFNLWGLTPMEASAEQPGLFTSTLTVGASGQESFQVAVNGDPDCVLHPSHPRCTRKAAQV